MLFYSILKKSRKTRKRKKKKDEFNNYKDMISFLLQFQIPLLLLL